MSNIFVTGVAGFLGSHIAEALLKLGHTVSGTDNMIGGDLDNVPNGVVCYRYDCCDTEWMRSALKGMDIVYHCAATAYEGLSVFSPAIVTRNIVDASVSTFSAAIANKVKRIVFCSSMARYGSQWTPFQEWMVPVPQDPYGIGKLCAEDILRNLCRVHGVKYTIAVPHNIIGPRQKYDDPYRNVASIMLNLNLQGRPTIIYGDGLQERCFSFIDDCISCLVKMGFQDNVLGEVVNIGPDEEPVTIKELADVVALETGNTLPYVFMPGRPQEVRVALCSSDKARKLLEYRTRTSLDSGIHRMADYIRKRGTRPFVYHLPIEIEAEHIIPRTWKDRLF